MIDSYGRIVDEPDDFEEQPECPCGSPLAWEPELERRVVGYPGQEFVEVREYRDCSCGARHWDGGWNEELKEGTDATTA